MNTTYKDPAAAAASFGDADTLISAAGGKYQTEEYRKACKVWIHMNFTNQLEESFRRTM